MMPKVGEWFTVGKQPLVRKRQKLKEPYKVLTKICYVYLISFARQSAASSFLVCQQSRILLSTGAKSSSIRVTVPRSALLSHGLCFSIETGCKYKETIKTVQLPRVPNPSKVLSLNTRIPLCCCSTAHGCWLLEANFFSKQGSATLPTPKLHFCVGCQGAALVIKNSSRALFLSWKSHSLEQRHQSCAFCSAISTP